MDLTDNGDKLFTSAGKLATHWTQLCRNYVAFVKKKAAIIIHYYCRCKTHQVQKKIIPNTNGACDT